LVFWYFGLVVFWSYQEGELYPRRGKRTFLGLAVPLEGAGGGKGCLIVESFNCLTGSTMSGSCTMTKSILPMCVSVSRVRWEVPF
jgi:hypothetical protein